MNVTDTESRPVLGPAGNKARPTDNGKPASKPLKKAEKPSQGTEKKAVVRLPKSQPMILKQQQEHHHTLLNTSMNASCSSDASSTDSSHSGRAARRSVLPLRRKHFGSKAEKVERTEIESPLVKKAIANEVTEDSTDCVESKRRCAWITPSTGMFCFCPFGLLQVFAC